MNLNASSSSLRLTLNACLTSALRASLPALALVGCAEPAPAPTLAGEWSGDVAQYWSDDGYTWGNTPDADVRGSAVYLSIVEEPDTDAHAVELAVWDPITMLAGWYLPEADEVYANDACTMSWEERQVPVTSWVTETALWVEVVCADGLVELWFSAHRDETE